jgi:hypothetical protein
MKKASIVTLCTILVLSGCTSKPKQQTVIAHSLNTSTDSCPVIASGKWHAWLDKVTEDEGQYRLVVEGEVTLPHPGFEIHWSQGPTDRMYSPGLRLSLLPKALDHMWVQVLTPVPVIYQLNTPISQFSSVQIYCDQTLLSAIVDVRLTD